MKHWSFSILALLALSACKSFNYNSLKSGTTNWEFSVHSGSCYKTCPVYQATINEDGILRFTGIAQTSFKGDTILELGSEFAYNLMLDLEAMDFLKMEDQYGIDSSVFDAQTVIYELGSEGELKRVSCQLEEPQDLYIFRTTFNRKLKAFGLL